MSFTVKEKHSCALYLRRKRICMIFFLPLVSDTICCLMYLVYCYCLTDANITLEQNQKWGKNPKLIIKLLLGDHKTANFKAGIFPVSKLKSGIICAGRSVLVLNQVCNISETRTAFFLLSLWKVVLVRASLVMDVNTKTTKFCIVLGTTNNYFQYPSLL